MQKNNEDMKIEINPKEQTALFIKVGIVVLSCLVIIGFGVTYLPKVIVTSNLSHKRELPIFNVSLEEKKVALSFDVEGGNAQVQTIMDILSEHNVKATFFMTGEWMENYPESVKNMLAAGHDLGNHSENHQHMSQLSKEECMEELMLPHQRVKELTGYEMKLFRPPYGDYNNTLIIAAKERGYYTIQWDVDSLDWKDYGIDSIINETVNNKLLTNGSIILLHNGAKYTPKALESVITGLQNNGYDIVPVSELICAGE